MKKLAGSLSDEEKNIFTESFYWVTDSRLDDRETDSPFGCPWDWGALIVLRGHSIEDMALNFWLDHKEEITRLVEAV